MNTRAIGSEAARAAGVVGAVTLLTIAVLLLTPAAGSSGLLGAAELAPDLRVHLGLHGAAAAGIWTAFMSPWAMALSLALIPLGFSSWLVTIRLTFAALVRQLGKEAARKAALTF